MSRTSTATILLSVTTICILTHALAASGTLIDVIVDDQDPSISYSPEWHIGQTCTVCTARVDASQVYNGTWSDDTYLKQGSNTPQNATFKFNGSAIFVFGAQLQLSGKSSADVLFFVDDQMVSTYTFTPSGPQDVATYGQLLFSQDNLKEAPHTLTLQNGRVGGAPSLVLFDYLVYTTDTSNMGGMYANATTGESFPAKSLSQKLTCDHCSVNTTATASTAPRAATHAASRLDIGARIAAICLGSVFFLALLVIAGMARMIRRQRHTGGRSDSIQADVPLLPTPMSTWNSGSGDHTAVTAQPFPPTPFLLPPPNVPPQEPSASSYNALYRQGKPTTWVLASAQNMPAGHRIEQGQARSELPAEESGSVVSRRSAPPAYQSVSGDMM
ncbi:hypothetical protein PsYK624_054160 [Phanerochaete sordida]|uniref:Uncharacterized protein n=1 Tax=Phanerochaete sordida TaxID=48140 RepID=A0A9P3G522_9APHY|nr:hypothetical protein PsYK624_054160 [Phanerochaete sordida]